MQKLKVLRRVDQLDQGSLNEALEHAIKTLKQSTNPLLKEERIRLQPSEVALISKILEHQMYRDKKREKLEDYTKEAVFVILGAVLSFLLNKL